MDLILKRNLCLGVNTTLETSCLVTLYCAAAAPILMDSDLDRASGPISEVAVWCATMQDKQSEQLLHWNTTFMVMLRIFLLNIMYNALNALY